MSDGRMYLNEDALNLILHKIADQARLAGKAAQAMQQSNANAVRLQGRVAELRAALTQLEQMLDEWVDYWPAARARLCCQCEKALPDPPKPRRVEIPF